jgi:membrane glycosyltransferase
LQHLRLLATRGLHPVSRFHMFSGAMGYLLSPMWFALLVVWALIGNGEQVNVVQYFSDLNPQVNWPKIDHASNFAILAFMYSMLLLPKMMAAGTIRQAGIPLRELGGLGQFLASLLAEIVLSVLYAPILMVQQTMAVLRTALGIRIVWKPQSRRSGYYEPAVLFKFHWLETLIGVLLLSGMVAGVVTLWLLPIAISLAASVGLSALSGVDLEARRWLHRQMSTPERLNTPPIIRKAAMERKRFERMLERPSADGVAAE